MRVNAILLITAVLKQGAQVGTIHDMMKSLDEKIKIGESYTFYNYINTRGNKVFAGKLTGIVTRVLFDQELKRCLGYYVQVTHTNLCNNAPNKGQVCYIDQPYDLLLHV